MSDIKTDLLALKWHTVNRPAGSAQVRFRWGGRLVSISTGKAKAEDVTAKEARAMIARWFASRKLRPVTTPGANFDSEIDRFIRLRYEGRAQSTVLEVRRHLHAFRAALGVERVQDATKKLCEARKDAMLGRYKPRETKAMLSTLRRFCRWQVAEGNMAEDPLVNFRNPSRRDFPVRTEIWTEERMDATAEHLSPGDREVFTVLRHTGMDAADIWGMTAENIITSPFPKIHKLRAKAKSSLEVIDQPISSKALPVLMEWKARWKGRFFPEWRLSKTFSTCLLDRLKTAQRKAGFPKPLDIKSLRHTFATRHAKRFIEGQGGPPMEELRRWMGHAPDSRVLERLYVHARSSGLYMD